MSRFDFAFSVSQVENGGFVATCCDFPHLRVKGKDWTEVLANAEAEMETIFLDHMQAHLDVPAPSAAAIVGECLICVPARTASKARIYDRSRLHLTEKLAKFDSKKHGGEYLAFSRVGREIWD
jgi:predicted RNase H-like HicB family nuclease